MERLHVLSLGLDNDAEREVSSEHAVTHAASPQRVDEDSTSLVYRRVRRQVVARGLARHHGDGKPKESHQRARSTRLQKQLAIIDEYHRAKAREEARLLKKAELKRSQSATAIAPQQGARFARKISLRQLPPRAGDSPSKNQVEDSSPSRISSPRATDIEAYAVLASRAGAFSPRGKEQSGAHASEQTEIASSKPKKQNSGERGTLHQSTAQVMYELQITKDIMMREHLVEQIHEAVSALNTLAAELHELTQSKAKLESSLSSTAPPSATSGVGVLVPRRSSISLTTAPTSGSLSIKKEKPREDAVAIADAQAKLESKLTETTLLVKRRVTQLHRLVATFQTTTIEIVESILAWRAQKSKRTVLSNVDKLHRFAWKHRQRHVINYLAHVDVDLRDLFPCAAMGVLVGIHTKYNPLLLPRAVLETLGIPDDTFVSTTFLTEERRELRTSRKQTDGGAPRASVSELQSPTRRQAHAALHTAVKALELGASISSVSHLDADRLRRCLEAIHQEQELERAAEERVAMEKQRQASAYNPFETIKAAGGVEDSIASIFKHQRPNHAATLAEELRHRQEDTTRAKETALRQQTKKHEEEQDTPSQSTLALHVNARRLRLLMDQRSHSRDTKADCELRDPASSWTKNKLHGQVMMRKTAIRRQENQHARKIQRQFQAYRRRTQLLKNLTHFVMHTRQRVVSIQKIVRGFIAKRRYQDAKDRHDLQRRRHAAARLIWFTYKKYKRRQRHRQSMSIDTIAQIQLIRVLQQQLDDTSASRDGDGTATAERYRKVGEERRRQRAVHLLKKRQEILEMEARQAAAATRIQSVYRMHSARQLAVNLRGERRAHLSAVSAMMIQSKIRKFLKHQEKRRHKFLSDMERVNRSAVRIQSIYRGYNSRASLVVAFEDHDHPLHNANGGLQQPVHEEEDSEEEDYEEDEDEEEEEEDGEEEQDHESGSPPKRPDSYTVLPPIPHSRPSSSGDTTTNKSRPSSSNSSGQVVKMVVEEETTKQVAPVLMGLPPIRPRAQSVETPPTRRTTQAAPPPQAVRRQSSNGMMKVELKLKETMLGDDFDAASSNSSTSSSSNTATNGLAGGPAGSFRRRFSRTTSSTSSNSDTSGGSFRTTSLPPA